jgi:hypothetical protein
MKVLKKEDSAGNPLQSMCRPLFLVGRTANCSEWFTAQQPHTMKYNSSDTINTSVNPRDQVGILRASTASALQLTPHHCIYRPGSPENAFLHGRSQL